MQIRLAESGDKNQLINLIAHFRIALANFKSKEREPDLERAAEELEDYQEKDYPIYVAEIDNRVVGYLVCKVVDTVVWAESLYVLPDYRKRGIGSALYAEAEKLVEKLGGETLYNWVHPNNDKIIAFLKKQGYNVLNLVEVRKRLKGEETTQKIQVNNHQFDY